MSIENKKSNTHYMEGREGNTLTDPHYMPDYIRGLFESKAEIGYIDMYKTEGTVFTMYKNRKNGFNNIFKDNGVPYVVVQCNNRIDELNSIDIPYDIFDVNGKMVAFFVSNNCIDFLSYIYDGNCEIYDNHVKSLYHKIHKKPTVCFKKTSENAVAPSKHRASDIGYDLTIISCKKKIGTNTHLYDTGIQVKPEYGYYTKIYPRSSLSKSGYMLANSVGIIDPTYRGNLLIALTKIDENAKDIEFPFKCAQLIIEKSVDYTMKEVYNNITESVGRGSGGFGSTNKKQH